jgi:hypothetical protein
MNAKDIPMKEFVHFMTDVFLGSRVSRRAAEGAEKTVISGKVSFPRRLRYLIRLYLHQRFKDYLRDLYAFKVPRLTFPVYRGGKGSAEREKAGHDKIERQRK